MHDEVILNRTATRIVANINVGINIFYGYALINFAMAYPFGRIVANKIIVIRRNSFVGNDLWCRSAAQKIHAVGMRFHGDAFVYSAACRAGTVIFVMVKHVGEACPIFGVVLQNRKAVLLNKESTGSY